MILANPKNAERNAKIFRLYGEGFSYAEIATCLGISRNAVAGTLHRAKAGNRGGRRLPLEDLTGKTFGRLIVLRRWGSNQNGAPKYLCKCKCLAEKIVLGVNLKNGRTKSCGCLHRERVREANQKRYEFRRFGSAA